MKGSPFDFSVTLLAPEDVHRFTRGMTMVGCLQHDAIVWSLEREGWSCPACGYQPPPQAETAPLVVTAVDYKRGTITVG